MTEQDYITFGPVHLEIRDVERTARFWRDIVGFEQRTSPNGVAMGISDETLLVLHGGARTGFKTGHSGLYHVAIHPPSERDFARILKCLIDLHYPISPTDHTFSKAIYLDDPDGINIEITLETPERFKGTKPGPGNRLIFIGTDGVERPGAYALDLDKVFRSYETGSEKEPAAQGTKVGHLHLYVADLAKSRDFYVGLGMELARWWPPRQVADFGAGGPFQHRIAVNTWQGIGAPPAPEGTARMRHFEVRFDSPERLRSALAANPAAIDIGEEYELVDPSGICLRLSKVTGGRR